MSPMQQSEEQPIRVLSASANPHLNHSRALLLRQHGFDVTTSESNEHAREQIKSSSFDVLIFGSTLTRDACCQLAEVFRQSNSDGKIIEILPSPEATVKNQPDAIVVSTDEPSKLIGTIHESLRKTSEGKDDGRWKQLCAEAAVEQDPDKLMHLLQEIDRLLDERDQRKKRSWGDES
jgi:DNA-binding NtrC family response regulator